ncbi:MAG TPA: aminopeptidase [Nitrosomonas sp.]|uniref:aminopeptidase n=1 Tax=Nitrosomonas sp. TaxID=42353 RepID=UPI002082500E|nr:aminopeptidase [Nitrosomonas sp.]GJL76560.1 MAG: aminopeptidase [Nitrosomonas sp.]HNP25466.1 aminopeptidase [Nitrosomonas sp.]
MTSLSGCASLAYYAQAVDGHMDIMRRSQPINAMIADPGVDPDLKRTLNKIITIRNFASNELKLPSNRSYTKYADLERPYAVWNVVAAPEFSFKLKEWCFIKAGCVSYRGFFSLTKAENYADKLRAKGYDVHVSGIPAYSTLGWFVDPVLNTFIDSELELARLIFHELAHQVVYVPGDTVFNESFATLVEQEGVKRWLVYNGTTAEYAEYRARQKRQRVFNTLVRNHRARLEMLFDADISEMEKRAGKARIFDDLREQFALLKTGRTEFNRYDRWFSQPVNNARLANVSVYTQLIPAFQALLFQQNGDMSRFFNVVKEISKLTKEERSAALNIVMYESRQKNLAGVFESHSQ